MKNSVLMTAASWVTLGFLGLLAVSIIYFILTGKINLARLISEPNGDASMSRFQLLIFTFVIAASLFLVIASPDPPVFPKDVPQGVLLLLGISSSSYLVSKGIQFSSDQGITGLAVSPAAVHARIGGPAVQFTATVTRAGDQGVAWSVEVAGGGTVDKNGLYTPPTAAPPAIALPAMVTVRATSTADPSVSDTGAVVLAAA
jgi:hypothetical protein